MNPAVSQLKAYLETCLKSRLSFTHVRTGMLTLDVPASDWLEVCNFLRYDRQTRFDQLIDLCGVDYLSYGTAEWDVSDASNTGFSRAVKVAAAETEDPFAFDTERGSSNYKPTPEHPRRFAVVVHLLSVEKNQRIRVRTWCEDDQFPRISSLITVWRSVDWYEREAFDLFGILFEGHPDLRRILTDYGFVGHPFRKDFPLLGQVEMRYDAQLQRVVYEPVSVEARTLVPRVIREGRGFVSSEEIDD